MVDWDNPFSCEAHHTSNICFLHLVPLNKMWNHYLNLVWPPWLWVVQPWWVDLVIVDLMVLGKFLGFSLLNPRVTTYFSTMFISILFDKNIIAKVG